MCGMFRREKGLSAKWIKRVDMEWDFAYIILHYKSQYMHKQWAYVAKDNIFFFAMML